MKAKNSDDSTKTKREDIGCSIVIILVFLLLFGGKYVRDYRSPQDKSTMEQQFKQKAKEMLFQMYTTGKPENLPPLKTCINMANQGDVDAQLALFYSYFSGWYGEEDREEAVKWLRKAAVQNNEFALVILPLMYFSGTGVEEDYTEAIEWLRLGTKNDKTEGVSANMLGALYECGLYGLQKDKDEARKWYQKALEQGCKAGEEGLRSLD